MSTVLHKILYFYKHYGIFYLIRIIILHPLNKYRNYKLSVALNHLSNAQDFFTHVYWDGKKRNLESLSGVGSTLVQTSKIRKKLPILLSDFNITSIIDAPCGDFNWMIEIISDYQGKYLGIDIVQPLIKDLNHRYASDRISFENHDLMSVVLPPADLLITRDFLFHLSFEDINKFLINFKKSNIKYLLTTSHHLDHCHINKDIKTGDFRAIDLFKKPFHFPLQFADSFEDYVDPEPPRSMFLWKRDDLPDNFVW